MPMTKATTPAPVRKTAILAVSGSQPELEMLRCLFTGSSWALSTAATLADAEQRLEELAFPVVLCDDSLPDGDWKALLHLASGLEEPPPVVVMSRTGDESLWLEALNSGAYDVLAGPCSQKDMFRTLSNAWRSWKERKHRGHAVHVCV